MNKKLKEGRRQKHSGKVSYLEVPFQFKARIIILVIRLLLDDFVLLDIFISQLSVPPQSQALHVVAGCDKLFNNGKESLVS